MRIDEDDLAWDLPSMAPAPSPYSGGAGAVTLHSVHPGALSSIREDASALSSHNSSLRHSAMAARPSAYPAYPMGAFSAPPASSAFLSGGFGAATRSSPEDETSPGTDGLDGADADGIDMDEGMENGADEGTEEVQRLKPHKCDTCGACFARKVHLQRHALRHVTSKPYSCELCGKCFSRQDSLVRHNRLLHEKDGRTRVGSNGKPLPPASFRNRSPKACLRCSQLKTRCDGNEPCARCVSHNLGGPGECTYRPGADRRSRSSSSRGVSAPRPERRQSMLDGVESDDEGAEEKPARGRPLSRFDAGSASSNGSASNASVGERGTSIYSASYDDGRVHAAAPLSPASWQSASSIGAHFSSMHLQQSGSQQSHSGAPALQHQRSHSQQAMPTAIGGHHHHDANHAFIQAQHTNQAAFLGLSLPQQLDVGGTNGFGANNASNNFFLQQQQQQSAPPQQQQAQSQHQQPSYPASFAQAIPATQQTSDFYGGASSTAPLHLSFSAPAHTAVGFAVPPANGHGGLGHSNGNGSSDDAFAPNLHLEFDWSDYHLPDFPLAGSEQSAGPTVARPRLDGLGFQPTAAPSGPMKNNPFGGSMFLAPAARGVDLGDLEAAMNADSPLSSNDANNGSAASPFGHQQNVSESLASLAHQLGSADGHYWDTTSFTTR